MSLFELRYDELLDNSPDAMVIVDENGLIAFANRQVKHTFGFDPAELTGRAIEILLPARHEAAHRKYRHAFNAKPVARTMGVGLELLGRHKDGAEFPVDVSLSPLETSKGNFVLAAVRDVTTSRQLQRSLAGILERSLNEVYTFHAETLRFIQANEGARRNLGYSLDELNKLTALDLKPEFNEQSFRAMLAPLIEGSKERITFATQHRRKDGSRYPVEVHLQRMRFNTAWVFVALILDITERREAEKTIVEHQQHLERRVKERTAELTESENALRHAKDAAEHATRLKSRFLAAASHDLRQPLQAIGLYLTVLAGQLDKPETREIAAKMQTSLEATSELLDALLDITQLESGSVKPELTSFAVRDMFEQAMSAYGPQAAKKGLELVVRDSSAMVTSDRRLLQRVVDNFVSNAVRYTDAGRIELGFTSSGRLGTLSVKDTGPGIHENALENIFEEYFQLDNPTRDRRKGLGLGLAIVAQIARLLDHPVHVDSTPGTGSVFSIDVPLAGREVRDRSDVERAGLNAQELPRTVVIFVDDDPAIMDAFVMVFKATDLRVYTAADAESALAHIESGIRPDVIVTDYRLPELSGLELIRRIRELTSKTIPAVLMTGDTANEEINSAGFESFAVLHKPVRVERLLDLIAQFTD